MQDSNISFRGEVKEEFVGAMSDEKHQIEDGENHLSVTAASGSDEKGAGGDNEVAGNDWTLLYSPEETEILRRQLEIPSVKVDFKSMFRYATTYDLVVMTISGLCAIAAGIAIPIMTVIFGELTSTFDKFYLNQITEDEFNNKLKHSVIWFVYLAIIEFFTTYAESVGFIHTGERISATIRAKYLEACLQQNMAFFDKLGSGEFTTRITSDANLVQDGISEKMGLTLTAISSFSTAFVIGFITYWKLTLILCAGVVAIIIIMAVGSVFIVKYENRALESYALGGTVAEEVISSIRTATAFGTQEKLAQQYDDHLVDAQKWDMRAKLTIAVNIGAMFSIIYMNYALAFWAGSKYVVSQDIDVGGLLKILLSIMIGAFALGNVSPNLQAFTTAVSAARNIYATIDRVSPINPDSEEGLKLETVQGQVEFRHVKHVYASRPNVVVLRDLNLVIPAGKTTALVGASGSGKSTIVGLLERFYDPVKGQIMLDGHDISGLNVRWLRQQMALVSQEPVLFNTTVYENIRFGLHGSEQDRSTVEPAEERQLVINAARMANAHDFIMALPEGYETNVGERGMLLSGGQKQRIAIAQAMISNPKILLLDEATSALDTKSEAVVQAALTVAGAGRTTIAIAHRLSTIKDADNIVVMGDGRILEQGTHEELLRNRSHYYDLIQAQQLAQHDPLETKEETFDDTEDAISGTGHLASTAGLTDEKTLADAPLKTAETNGSALEAAVPVANRYGLWKLIQVIRSLNREEWHLMLIGFLFSIICGGANPTQAVIFGKEIVSLSRPLSQAAELRSDSNFWSLMYVMLSGVQFGAYCTQGAMFAICSARLIRRARFRAFRAILRQNIDFFDRTDSGILTSFLSTETTHVAGLSGVTLGSILSVSTTLVAAIIVSCALGWKLALVCMSTIPVVIGCGFLRFWMLNYFTERAKKVYEDSAAFACEATVAIRTVAALTREQYILNLYRDSLTAESRRSIRKVAKTSILYGFSQATVLLCIGLGFWYGGTLISTREYTILQFFICFAAIIFGAQSAGTVFSFAPDMSKARTASAKLHELFERLPAIDWWSPSGKHVDAIRGEISFRDVHFAYPTRPHLPVLQGLNLDIQPGQHIALVGASGCGKSTTISLMERFYDPQSGAVLVDGQDIRSLNISDYRSFLAVVPQEPTLYQGTIRDNIVLGTPRTDVTDEEIEKVCREANIYDFITSLSDGFSTVVGAKGSMLSGGQKQRIAIARALLRDPRILLLDEATSALDSESESAVQAAIDAASKGRTTISIAHRLSTIKKAETIFLFDQGRIVEHGTHEQLIAHNGKYSDLVSLQNTTTTT